MKASHFATLLLSLWIGVVSVDAAGDSWDQIKPFFSPPAELEQDFGSFKSPLLFDNGVRARSPEDWQQRRTEILDYWKRQLGDWPSLIEKPRFEFLSSEQRDNFHQHRVRWQVAPNQNEEAYLLIPKGSGPFPAVLVPFYEPETSIGRKGELRDFAYQLAKRGFVTLSIGSPGGDARKPEFGEAKCQPLYFLAYVAANGWNALASLPDVDAKRIGVVGHSYGGKWAMFASCFYEKFACAVWCDGGVVFDETRPNVNYWEPWYLGYEWNSQQRPPGVPSAANPRTGAYKSLVDKGRDLHELHALMAPRPFLVSGGSEDPPERWKALNHARQVNALLGYTNRVAMTNRKVHSPTLDSNEQIYRFFEYFLKGKPAR